MIKVSVMYPHSADYKFDMTYYLGSHMPMVRQKLGAALKGAAVDEGVAGGLPGSPPKYVAICHLLFESVDAFQLAFSIQGASILADIPNYTDIQPALQISEVRM